MRHLDILRRLTGAAVLVLGASVALVPGPARAAVPIGTAEPVYSVTIAARACDTYTDIMANRARNNIQQSLKDLGKDSVYSPENPVRPDVEVPNDPNCAPLDGWSFQFGDGSGGPQVDLLSTVTNPGRISGPTGTVPLLDNLGAPTGATIGGAVNVTLTADELALAQNRNLWVQGGTSTDPLLTGQPVNSDRVHGFGALRCAIDNLNGDNVEWIGFPQSVRHVFCYYYTVTPAPTAGSIIVRKALAGGITDTHTFRYNGNVSYVPGGGFDIPVNAGQPGSIRFDRAGGTTWNFTELADEVYRPVGAPVCTKTGGSTITIAGQAVTVALAPEDVVTCTYTNERTPTGPLTLYKQSSGGVGTFGFVVKRPDGTTTPYTATTSRTDTPVQVATNPNGPTGDWTVSETLPSDPGGTWSLARAECNGKTVPLNAGGLSATVPVITGESLTCTAFNTFAPAGAIGIVKRTVGDVGTFNYVVRETGNSQAATAEAGLRQSATTTAENTDTPATGDALTGLPVYTQLPGGGQAAGRSYTITELQPPDTVEGTWQLTGAVCTNNARVDRTVASSTITVALRPSSPSTVCTFENTFFRFPQLSVTKQVTGDPAARTGDVSVTLLCSDAPDDPITLTGPAGEPGPFALPGQPYVFKAFPTTCTLSEPATGAAPGATVTSSISITNGTDSPKVVQGTDASFVLEAGDVVSVLVSNDYVAAVTPTPTATPAPTVTPRPLPTATGGGQLPNTGAGQVSWQVAMAGLLICAGAVLVAWPRRRRSARA